MMKNTFSSEYHGEEVEKILSDCSKVVSFHSEFKSGVNLKVGDDLVYLSYPYFQLPPFGMMLSANTMDVLKPVFNTGKLRMQHGEIIVNDFHLTYKKSHKVQTHIEKENIECICSMDTLKKYAEQSPLMDYLFDGDINQLISKVIGFGQGLTPSGDDFVVGLLALNSRINYLPETVFQTIRYKITEKHTTDVSIAYLKSALNQQYSSMIVDVISSLDDPSKLIKALELLAKMGHSSGIDTIAGIYYGLRLIQK
ncbi:DUF2877 domain-containing protein [Vagococcus sp. JNUCC 83]